METSTVGCISEVPEAESATGFCLLAEMERRTDGRGRQRVTGRLADAGGAVGFVAWDVWRIPEGVAAGDAVKVEGEMGSYRGERQFVVQRLRAATADDVAEGLDLGSIVPSAPAPPDGCATWIAALQRYRDNLKRPEAVALWDLFLERYGARFETHPAATRVHHAVRGGLAWHVTTMMELATQARLAYGTLWRRLLPFDVDVVQLGILLHDSGKLVELPSLPGSPWNPAGHLVGHVVIGSHLWHGLCDAVASTMPVSGELRAGVDHVILSHHGELSKGAPVTPRTPEALLVSALDGLDARLATIWAALDAEGEQASERTLGGPVWGAAPAVDAAAVAAAAPEALRLAPGAGEAEQVD